MKNHTATAIVTVAQASRLPSKRLSSRRLALRLQGTALLLAAIAMTTGGCSLFHHHEKQPKNSFKIIPLGDRNPAITNTPEVMEDTPTRKVEVETGPVGQ